MFFIQKKERTFMFACASFLTHKNFKVDTKFVLIIKFDIKVGKPL